MRPRIIHAIFWKELRDTLRDRRTLLIMIGLPVVLYPALILLGGSLTSRQIARLKDQPVKIALLGEPSPQMKRFLERRPGLTLVAPPADKSADALLAAQEIDAAIEVPAGTARSIANGVVASLTVVLDETRDESREAAGRLQEALNAYRQQVVEAALARRGLPAGVATPWKLERRNVASPERMGAFLVSKILPILLVSLLVIGAFYPAIDLTAGEKERGTLETLLTSPVRPMEIVTGKYLAILCVSLLAGVANLASLGLSAMHGLSLLPQGGKLAFDLSLDRVAMVFVAIIPLALLASALCLAIAVLAKSFKEAQNLLSPTLLVLIMPAAVAGMPGLDLDPFTAFVPGLNAALLTKALLMGEASLDGIFSVVVANLLFTALALVFAARNFSNEAVLFGGEGGPFKLRRPGARPRGGRATPGQAIFIFVTLFVLWWYIAQSLQRWDLVGGVALSQFGLLLVPVVGAALFLRLDLRETFRLHLPGARGWIAAALVGTSATVVVPAVVLPLQNLLLPETVQFAETMRKFFQISEEEIGEVGMLLLVALTPALCEEAVFRGLLLDGLSRRYSKAKTILAVSILFGIMHLSIYRFLPTAVMGALLAYLVLETGSIFVSILTHGLYNGLLVLVALDQGLDAEAPVWLVGVAALALFLGLWLARGASRSRGPGQPHCGRLQASNEGP
jgi:sodium transport system permease protein